MTIILHWNYRRLEELFVIYSAVSMGDGVIVSSSDLCSEIRKRYEQEIAERGERIPEIYF